MSTASLKWLEAVSNQDKPWRGLAEVEEYLRQLDGKAAWCDINWEGIVFSCARLSREQMAPGGSVLLMLAWAQLAITLREAVAGNEQPDARRAILRGAMWARANAIKFCGDFPGDPICDCRAVVEWCFSSPKWVSLKGYVQESVRDDRENTILLDPEIRADAQLLEFLRDSCRYNATETELALLSRIAEAVKRWVRGSQSPQISEE